MPAKRNGSDLGRRMTKSTVMRNRRAQGIDEQIQQNNEDVRGNMAQLRESQSQEARSEQIQLMQLEQRQAHRFVVDTPRANDQQHQQVHRAFTSDSFHRLVFEYEPDIKFECGDWCYGQGMSAL
ncbi:ATP-dependent DNA helicase [Trichonephila inaurata madagascariensis]|uniref:ATP-dependent DNA helicase n=1 Tax=Trichonephila inaurata madagascariensis TaxID=2747483 RepID=A0A8X7C4L5_9ARAC|nr:ATP-dependent DNA helicase [Trichonephila inaurata madagascariensis]